MQTDFIAHPETVVGQLLESSFDSLGIPLELVIVSAFASMSAVLRLKSRVEAIRASGGATRLILGVDLGGTSKEVLQEVAGWNLDVTIMKNRLFGCIFHPKIYYSRWQTSATIIVGSNNLTDGGLYRNYEAASRSRFTLPDDEAELNKSLAELGRYIKPSGETAKKLTPEYLSELLALPEIPSELRASKTRAEGIPRRPVSSAFGYEMMVLPPSITTPKKKSTSQTASVTSEQPTKVPRMKLPRSLRSDSLAIQVRAHHNGEIFLSVTAALQHPEFFKWPFNGLTTPKKVGKAPYPQLSPDPRVNIVVWGASGAVMFLNDYALNTVYYSSKSEIRITASPLLEVMPDNSIMIIRRSDLPERDYDIAIHRPDSPDYEDWLKACDQKMPGGGKEPRRFGWF